MAFKTFSQNITKTRDQENTHNIQLHLEYQYTQMFLLIGHTFLKSLVKTFQTQMASNLMIFWDYIEPQHK